MRPIWKYALLAAALVVLAHLLDGWAWATLTHPGIYDNDRGRMLRIFGYLPVWILMAIALWLHSRDRRRALMLALVPALGGLVAELLKLLIRRERPKFNDGAYVFRSFADHPFSTKGLGMPSSHALVAFAAAWLLVKFYPKAWPVWLFLAAGCGYTRVVASAHFLSDVTVAAVAAWVVVEVCWRRFGGSDGAAEMSGARGTAK